MPFIVFQTVEDEPQQSFGSLCVAIDACGLPPTIPVRFVVALPAAPSASASAFTPSSCFRHHPPFAFVFTVARHLALSRYTVSACLALASSCGFRYRPPSPFDFAAVRPCAFSQHRLLLFRRRCRALVFGTALPSPVTLPPLAILLLRQYCSSQRCCCGSSID